MKCSIPELSQDEQDQLRKNAQNHQHFFGHPDTMIKNTPLEKAAAFIHYINDIPEVVSRRKEKNGFVTYVNRLGVELVSASKSNRRRSVFDKGTGTTASSLEASRNMLTGGAFDDVLMRDAWGWLMRRLSDFTEVSQRGDYKINERLDPEGKPYSGGTYQLAMIPSEVLRFLFTEESGADFNLRINLFGLPELAEDDTVGDPKTGTLLYYLLQQSRNGRYKNMKYDFEAAGETATASLTFDEKVFREIAEYVHMTFYSTLRTFSKTEAPYKFQSKSDPKDRVFSDLIIGTQVFTFSPQRNTGGFADLLFMYGDKKHTIITDFKTKSVLLNDRKGSGSPVNKSNQTRYNRQVQMYLDGIRYVGGNPLVGQLAPATMLLTRSNIEANGESTFIVGGLIHAQSGENELSKRYGISVSPFSSALIPQLEEQMTILSDFIEQTQLRTSETRATLKSATISDDPEVRKDIWDRVRSNALLLSSIRGQTSEIHEHAFKQMTLHFNISSYMSAALNLDAQIEPFQNDLEEYIDTTLVDLRRTVNPKQYLESMLDEFLIYQDMMKEYDLEINALKAVFNSQVQSYYVDGLIKMFSYLEGTSGLKMRDTFEQILKQIPSEYYPNQQKDAFIDTYFDFIDDNDIQGLIGFIDNKFRPMFEEYYTSISSRLDAISTRNSELNSELVIALVPPTSVEKQTGTAKKKLVVESLGFWDRWATRSELIDNPLFKIFNKVKDFAEQKTLRQYEERMKSYQKTHDDFLTYVNNSKMSYKEAVGLLVDTEIGMLHKRFVDDFYARKEDALQNQDAAWMRGYYEIRDKAAWLEEYEAKRDNYFQWLDSQAKLYEDELAANPEYYPDVGIDPKFVEQRKDEFLQAYNLNAKEGNAWVNRRNLKYLEPKKVVHERFASEKYEKIRSTEALFNMYEQLRSLPLEAKSIIGQGKMYIPEDFFPNIAATTGELALKIPQTGILSTAGKMVANEFRIAPIDETLGVYNEDTFGRNTIPFSGVVPLVNHDGNIYSEENIEILKKNAIYKSYDLYKVGNDFINSMYTYSMNQYTEPMVDALINFAKDEDRYVEERKIRGVTALTKTGTTRVRGGDTESAKLLEKYMHANWYQTRFKGLADGTTPDFVIPGLEGDPSKGKGPVTLVSATLGLRNVWSRNILGLAFIPGVAAGLTGLTNAFINSMEGYYFSNKAFRKSFKKYFNVVKDRQSRGMMRALALKFDAASIKTANYRGMKGARLQTKAVSDWTLYGPLRSPDMVIGDIITDSVVNSWGIQSTGNDADSRKAAVIARLEDLPEGAKPLSEFIFIDPSTNEVTFDENVIGQNQVGQIREIIRKGIAETYGQLPEGSYMGAQLTIIGTLATTFISWMPAIINKRVERTKVADIGSPKLNFMTTGRWRSIVTLLTSDRLKVNDDNTVEATIEDLEPKDMLSTMKHVTGNIIKNFVSTAYFFLRFAAFSKNADENIKRLKTEFYRWKLDNPKEVEKMGRPVEFAAEGKESDYDDWLFDKWVESQKRALKSATVELWTLATVMLLLESVRSFDYDEDGVADYKQYWASRQLVKLLAKTQAELIFMLNPSEWERFFTQPVAVTGMISDLIKVFENGYDEIVTDRFGYRENSANDKTPLFYYFANFAPGFRQIRKILEPFEQDKQRGMLD